MKKLLRIKPLFHLLRKDGQLDFIKTLDEGIRIPENGVVDFMIECFQMTNDAEAIHSLLQSRFELTEEITSQLIQKFTETGILECYTESIPENMERYHRQLLLFDALHPETDFEQHYSQQNKLIDSHILIIGIGGIGNFIALSLAAAGVGNISLADFDVVEETNLNRQVLFTEGDIGQSKVKRAAARLKEINSKCQISTFERKIHSANDLDELLNETGKVDFLVLSADEPPELVLWASSICAKHRFKYIKCGYMAYQGLIGPILGPDTKKYEELFDHWGATIGKQDSNVKSQNKKYIAPSMAATNAILSNIAALEIIKDLSGVVPSSLIENRLLFNLKTMELTYG